MSGISKYMRLAISRVAHGIKPQSLQVMQRWAPIKARITATPTAFIRGKKTSSAAAIQRDVAEGAPANEARFPTLSTEEESPRQRLDPLIEDDDVPLTVEFTSGEELKFIDLDTEDAEIVLGYQDVGSPAGKPLLAIHDVPGFSEDFKNLFEPLSKMGYRIIVPNIPGYGFSHSSEGIHDTSENAQILMNLLKKLSIKEVHGIMSEGSGCILACYLAAKTDVAKRLITINPSGFAPLSVNQWYGHLKSNPLTAPILNASQPDASQSLRTESILPLISALNSEASVPHDEVQEHAEIVGQKNIPILSIGAIDDILTTPREFVTFAKTCGIEDSNVRYIDLDQPAPGNKAVSSALVFKEGGHRALASHPKVVTDHILWMLENSGDLK